MRIAFLGDIALIGRYDLTKNKYVFERLYELKNKLSEYDYVIANLETPLTLRKKSFIPKSLHLKSNPINVEVLKFLNINAVTLANNHINDFGKKGIQDTIVILENNEIEWFGLYGKSLNKKEKEVCLSISGFSCLSTNPTGFSSTKKGINLLTKSSLINQLKSDNEKGCISILSLHWGREHSNYPNNEHIGLVKSLARDYTFLIHGHHPHVIQPVLNFSNSIVSFSLGNCLFDDMISLNQKKTIKQNDENQISFILDVNVENGVFDTKVIGFHDTLDGIEFIDISSKMKEDKKIIDNITDVKIYEQIRDKQFNNTIIDKFGKRTIKWFLNRINYYSIFSRLFGLVNAIKYKKIRDNFVQDNRNE